MTSGVIPNAQRLHFTKGRMAAYRRFWEKYISCPRTKKDEVGRIFKNYGMYVSCIRKLFRVETENSVTIVKGEKSYTSDSCSFNPIQKYKTAEGNWILNCIDRLYRAFSYTSLVNYFNVIRLDWSFKPNLKYCVILFLIRIFVNKSHRNLKL